MYKEYGVSYSALSKWVKQFSTVETDNGEVLTVKQVKELQKRNAQLEEENLPKRLQILFGLVILLISKQEASGIFFV